MLALRRWNTIARAARRATISARSVPESPAAFTAAFRAPMPHAKDALAGTRLLCATSTASSSAGAGEVKRFEAETSRLLDLVAHSLYTDREVFIRELISNASDALEKARVADPGSSSDFQITIDVNKDARTFVIRDNGIGMGRDELESHLGTIARSGSQALREAGNEGIIGHFGVGFYSCFMVSRDVTVRSRGHVWHSDTTSGYTIVEDADADAPASGTEIALELREDAASFADPDAVRKIIAKYSNFVGFPIVVNGERANKVSAIWREPKSSVTAEQHAEFYRFTSHAFDDPMLTVHFAADSPIDVKAALYVPTMHTEKFGMGRMQPGVHLYARKVLVQSKMAALLPDWLRFVRGVVESEDIPLHVSREHLQDSALVRKLGSVLTKKVTRAMADLAKKSTRARDALAALEDGADAERRAELEGEAEEYMAFYNEYAAFLKEGIITDDGARTDLAPLLRYETTELARGEHTSLDACADRAADRGGAGAPIHFLVASSRDVADASPYLEPLRARGEEVLLMYSPIEEFVMSHIGEYKGHPLVPAEKAASPSDAAKNDTAGAESGDAAKSDASGAADAAAASPAAESAIAFLREALADHASAVEGTDQLTSTPAMITDHEGAAHRMRRILAMSDGSGQAAPPAEKQKLLVNVSHPVILSLAECADGDRGRAERVARQLYDNALVAAGLMDDPREMLTRLNALLADAVSGPAKRDDSTDA